MNPLSIISPTEIMLDDASLLMATRPNGPYNPASFAMIPFAYASMPFITNGTFSCLISVKLLMSLNRLIPAWLSSKVSNCKLLLVRLVVVVEELDS